MCIRDRFLIILTANSFLKNSLHFLFVTIVLAQICHVYFLSLPFYSPLSVSYTHLRAHETSLHLVCRLLLEKKKNKNQFLHKYNVTSSHYMHPPKTHKTPYAHITHSHADL
eukprot:TRINITY_DN8962_c0_g1_i2.p1 TRINITY_DN8962_c0_g1~~TRINITY_DN8962_c0_g1_i2.p1  ORF type:complete len:111 (+),score=10.55 TRINITY_DN8962_c0_g1_i2:110-442(+)